MSDMSDRKHFVSSVVFPLLAALIWGTAFTAQSVCAQYITPFWVNALRSFIAAAVLLGICFFISHIRRNAVRTASESARPRFPGDKRALVIYSVLSGFSLFVASNLQQMGITLGTDSGKAGFITALYAVLVPVAGLFMHRRVGLRIWLAIAIAMTGLYFLCITGDFGIVGSDLLILGAAVSFVFQIIFLNIGAQKADPIALSCGEFLTTGVLSLICALIFEDTGTLAGLGACLPQLLYLAVFSSCIAYTLQVVSLRDGNPAVVSLLYCLECVFAVLSGALFLGEELTARELLGCGLMLVGVILSQLPEKKSPAEND